MSISEKPRKRLPVKPSLENLKKQAKRLVKTDGIALAEAQHRIAKEYGSRNWSELSHVVETMLRGADQLSFVKYEMEALPKAANDEDIAKMREILESGEFTQHDLDLALANCLYRRSRRPQADLLIEHGADVDGQYGSGFGPIVLITAEILEPDSLQYLLDHGCDVTFPPIETKYGPACPMLSAIKTYERGKNALKHRYIDLLLQHGAYVPPELKPWFLAIHRGDAAALKAELERDPRLVNQLFEEIPGDGNVNLDGCSLLHMALEFGEKECAEVLFDKVADINLRSNLVTKNGQTWGGHTPVFHVINSWQGAHTDLLEFVLQRAGNWIDMKVEAALRVFGEIKGPFTPLTWAGENQRERELLLPFDRKSRIKQMLRGSDEKGVAELLDAHPELLTPNLWPEAIYQAGSLPLVQLLLDRGLSPDECSAPRKPLHLAVYRCLADIVELLLERGADPNQMNPLKERPLDLLDSYEPRAIGDPEARRIRQALLAAGATEDIFCAVRAGDIETVRAMLDANPELVSTKSPDIGVPILFVAARSGRLEVARLLLQRGAEVDWPNSLENTALWFACQSPANAEDRIAVARLLLESGANPNKRCENGSTPLHFAAWRGPAKMVSLLLSFGADRLLQDDRGFTPADDVRRSKVNPEPEEALLLLEG